MKKKPTIFKQMKLDNAKRRKMKKSIDRAIALGREEQNLIKLNSGSSVTNQRGRLINEGAIVRSNGDVRLYIQKGTIEKFVSQLSDSYVGYISIGHSDLFKFPLSLGYWTKEDLHIVELDDGRKALDVDLHIDKDLNIVKDLIAQDIPVALSADLYPTVDWDMSNQLNVPIVKKFDIPGFSIVGNPANVDSKDIYLSEEGDDMNYEEFKEKYNKLNPKEEEKEPEMLSIEASQLDEIYQQVESVVNENKELKAKVQKLSDENEELKKEKNTKEEKKEEKKQDEKKEEKEALSNDKVKGILGILEKLSNDQVEKADKPKNKVWGI